METNPQILVVEDDADTRANLCDVLELDNHHVSVAATASEAREMVSANEMAIMILDRKLPDGIAEDLLPEFRELVPSMDIIVVTGYADLESAIEALKNGAADFLLKPISPEAIRTSIQRILQRRAIERKLHQEHELASNIFRTAEAIVLVLDLEGKIVRFNPYLTKISGWSLADAVGEDWFANFLPDDEREGIKEVFQKTARGMETAGILNPIVTRAGQKRQIRWSNTTLKDVQGDPTAVLAVGLDVTDLVEAQQRAVQSERLATIGQTMTALAHESRNALQRIQASSDILGLELEGNAQALEDLGSIRRAARELHTHLEEVRAFAAPIQLRLSRTNLCTVWTQAWNHLMHTFHHRQASLNNHSSQPVEAELDILRMEQVFRNLFENSLTACVDPVSIEIRCEHSLKDHIEISVADNGPGIRPDQRGKVFDAFYTTKETGTGLGMAIVRRIIDAHEGNIFVDEQFEQGARFVIRIPKYQTMPRGKGTAK